MIKYEQIVASYGYTYHYGRNVRGEQTIVIDRITEPEYQAINCDFFRWDAARNRAKGVVVYDRPECVV